MIKTNNSTNLISSTNPISSVVSSVKHLIDYMMFCDAYNYNVSIDIETDVYSDYENAVLDGVTYHASEDDADVIESIILGIQGSTREIEINIDGIVRLDIINDDTDDFVLEFNNGTVLTFGFPPEVSDNLKEQNLEKNL